MDNLDDVKALWQTARTDSLPQAEEMGKMARSFRNGKVRNKRLVIAASAAFSTLIIAVLIFGRFEMTVTYVGGALMVLAGILLAINNFRSLKRFDQLDNCSNVDFLSFVERTRQNQIYYYEQTMGRLVAMCTIGWLLYLYEFLYERPLLMIGLYTAALTYLAILWFLVRPRAFKRDAAKLDATRQRLETLSNQLK